MSCPNPNPALPLAQRGLHLDGDERLPWEFYVLTLAMILGLVGLPMLYRKTWVFIADLIADVKEDIAPLPPPAGCRRISRPATGNPSAVPLNESNSPRPVSFTTLGDDSPWAGYPADPRGEASRSGRIGKLYVYPIESTPPIELDVAALAPSGLAHDRAFALAQRVTSQPDPTTYAVRETWTALTRRSHPRLAQVATELWIPDEPRQQTAAEDDGEADGWRAAGGCLAIRFPFSADAGLASRDGLRALLARLAVALRARSPSAAPAVELRVPLRPDAARARARAYRVERVRVPAANEDGKGGGEGEEREAWDVAGAELPEEALAKLAFCLGVSNPLSLFFALSGKGRHGFQDSVSPEGRFVVVGRADCSEHPAHRAKIRQNVKNRFKLDH